MSRTPLVFSACLLALMGCQPDSNPSAPAAPPGAVSQAVASAAQAVTSAAQPAASGAVSAAPTAVSSAVSAAGVVAGEKAAALSGVIQGQVWYRQRIALPPDAVLTVQLVDVSRADAPAVVLASQTIQTEHPAPLAFELHYDPAKIDSRMIYAIQARIQQGDALRFITTERFAVLTRGAPLTDLKVRVDTLGR